MHDEIDTQNEQTADADLILRSRSGDREAFGELWRRHYPSGLAVARSVTSSIDPDDLVQESYARIFQAVVKGGGPNGSFRAYLFTTIRNTAAAWGRARKETAIDELDAVADPASSEQAADEALDRSLTAQAFRSLPSRWQEVLWYTEIEQMKPQEVAPLLGMKAGAVSQLAFRAREGLREAWIQAHLRSTEPDSECRWTIEHLGAYARGNLGTRDLARLERHVADCARCMIVAAEAKDVSRRLALVLLPLVLGVSGASGYLALLQQGGQPVMALAGAGSTIPGAVFGGGTAAAGAAGSLGASPAAGTMAVSAGSTRAGTTASGTGATGTTGGVLTGMSALVGAGSAALVVAGVVAATAIVPGLIGDHAMTSMASAGGADSAGITSDIAPDGSMNSDAPLVVATDPPAARDEKPDAGRRGDRIAPDPSIEADGPPSLIPGAPDDGLGTPAPPLDPQEPVDPTDPPVDPTDPPVDPTDPPVDPTDPPVDPTDPPVDPQEPTDPPVEPTDPPVVPGIPTGAPTIESSDVTIEVDGDITVSFRYDIVVAGAAGASIRPFLGGAAGADATLLATAADPAAGTAGIRLTPTFRQICDDAAVTLSYVDANGAVVGESLNTRLSALGNFWLRPLACELVFGVQGAVDDAIGATPPPAVLEPASAEPAAAEPAPVEPAPEAPASAAPTPSTEIAAPVDVSAPAPAAPAAPSAEATPAEEPTPAE